MNLTYLTFPDLPLTYPIFSGTWAFQISDSHLKNKEKMASLYVWEGLAMWVFWIFDLPRPTGLRDLKSERQAYKDLLLYVKRSTFFFFVFFGPSLAVRKFQDNLEEKLPTGGSYYPGCQENFHNLLKN
jgi:hypothetical protein